MSCVSVHGDANDAPRTPQCRRDTFAVDARTLQIEVDAFPRADDAGEVAHEEVRKVWRARGPSLAFVQVGVAPDGEVVCASLDKSAGDQRIDHAALRAVSRMHWQPALLDGRVSPGFVNVAVRGYVDTDLEACGRGFAWACHAAAHDVDGDDVDGHADRRDLLVKACALGDAGACTDQGRLDGDRVLLERTCALDAEACTALALLESSDARALELLTRGCDGKDGAACTALALREPADVRALVLLEQACVLRDVDGCALAGARLLEGRGSAVDEARGRMLRARACRRGHAAACVS